MNSVDQVFDLLGGVAEVGRAIGKRTEHSSILKRRGSIPVRYWPSLIRAAHERGVELTYDQLVQLHASPNNGEAA